MNGSPALRSGEAPSREYNSGESVCTVAPNAFVRISGLHLLLTRPTQFEIYFLGLECFFETSPRIYSGENEASLKHKTVSTVFRENKLNFRVRSFAKPS